MQTQSQPTTVEFVKTATAEAYDWIDDVVRALGRTDRYEALSAIRGALHALRDELTVDQNLKLASRLPTLIRGLYFEGWDPRTNVRPADRDEFLECAAREFTQPSSEVPTEESVRAVLSVLESRMPPECRKLKFSLPKSIRELWPTDSVSV